LIVDESADVVRFVPAYELLSMRLSSSNLRLLDGELLEEQLLDRLHMPPEHYSPPMAYELADITAIKASVVAAN
jgi:hypothetical protein